MKSNKKFSLYAMALLGMLAFPTSVAFADIIVVPSAIPPRRIRSTVARRWLAAPRTEARS